MPEIKLHITTTAFENPLSSRQAFVEASRTAKLISEFTESNLGYGIFLYERTMLSPTARAVQIDSVLLTITSAHSLHTREGIRRKYLSSPGLPVELMGSALRSGIDPKSPPAIIDNKGQVHLLELKRSQGQGVLWYKFNSGNSQAA